MGGWEKIKCNPPVLSSLLLWLGRRSKEPSTLLLSAPPLPPYSFHFTQQFIFTSNFHTKRSHTAGASYSLTLWLNMQGPAGISALYSYRRSTLKLFSMSVTRSSWTIIKILFYLIDLKRALIAQNGLTVPLRTGVHLDSGHVGVRLNDIGQNDHIFVLLGGKAILCISITFYKVG